MSELRVVLDTNVLVSGFLYRPGVPGKIVRACYEGQLNVVLSQFILDEVARVLPRMKRLALTPEKLLDLMNRLRYLSEIVTTDSETDPALRDPADQQILGTLRVSQADYLITGDKDLLALAEKYPIVTPTAFWTRHGS
jgi:putative PIN family toxin of toxin-antitoxin system